MKKFLKYARLYLHYLFKISIDQLFSKCCCIKKYDISKLRYLRLKSEARAERFSQEVRCYFYLHSEQKSVSFNMEGVHGWRSKQRKYSVNEEIIFDNNLLSRKIFVVK